MSNITQIIHDNYYSYNPNEFMPIKSGSKVLNIREFHTYKIKKIAGRMSHGLVAVLDHATSN